MTHQSEILGSPKAPWNQPFQGSGRKNKTKKKAWWQHSPFHNNRVTKKQNDPSDK